MQIASNVFTKFVYFIWNISTKHTTATLQTAQLNKVSMSLQTCDLRLFFFSSSQEERYYVETGLPL
jgi:hypothetical protein